MQELKKFHAYEDGAPIYYRDRTSDTAIINTTFSSKPEYMFPMFEPKMIFDIGANIGVISTLLANIYPDAIIHAFEPVKENYEILIKNTDSYPNIKPHFYGLGSITGPRRLFHSDDPTNHGGFSLKIPTDTQTEVLEFRAMSETVRDFGVPELIKVDVEGAEFEIFQDFSQLEAVKWIAGELHGVHDFRLLDMLSQHFRLKVERNFGDKIWHFHALNKSWEDFGRNPSSH